jgi:hypothetical protein
MGPGNRSAHHRPRSGVCISLCALLALALPGGVRAAGKGEVDEILGTWRGTSTCVDRKIAPACKDETVVYDVRRSDKPGTATLKADKIVDGQRVPMGELDFTYDAKDACWRSEFSTPRVHGIWCLKIDGKAMTGGLRALPENAQVRKVELKRD